MGEQGDVGAEGPEGLEADVTGLATMGHSAKPWVDHPSLGVTPSMGVTPNPIGFSLKHRLS